MSMNMYMYVSCDIDGFDVSSVNGGVHAISPPLYGQETRSATDTLRTMAGYTSCSLTIISVLLGAVITRWASGQCLFEKHFEKRLESSDVSAALPVNGVLECEKLCLEHPDVCLAANVVHVGGRSYNCEMLKQLPAGYSSNILLPNPRGKFILKQGKVLAQTQRMVSNAIIYSISIQFINQQKCTKVLKTCVYW